MLLLEYFDRCTRRSPSDIAVVTSDEQLTFAQLNRQADLVAAALAARHLCEEAVIAVSMPRSPQLIAVLLGVLKAGCAYLPLDPGFPAERVRYMLGDSRAELLIAPLALQPTPATLPVVSPEDICAGTSAETGPRTVPPDALAYVLYTSGSTGRPKGVEITHGALGSFLEAMLLTPSLARPDRVLAHTTISFDIAVFEIWLPLAAGATVVLVDRDVAVDARRLRAAIDTQGVTVVQATPTTWSLLLESGWTPRASIRAVSGGEPLPRDLAVAIMRGGAELWNLYGPTETTVWSSAWRVDLAAPGPILIGRPLTNTTFHVLDDERQHVPVGGVGELWIGGAGVARGYRGHPELTEARFVNDTSDPSGRLYRTGDLAREHPDGQYECLGRIDDQVKIDGYRIELEEIEAVLRESSLVKQAAVTLHAPGPGDQRLIAHVVAGATRPSPADLRQLAARRLPAYMVPAAFLFVDTLPRTPNGKIDRNALPPPRADFERPGSTSVAEPQTPTECALAEIWREVLRIREIGIHDDFFELGGRSRLGARMFALVAEQLGRVLPLASLFDAPTIATLAALIDGPSSAVNGWSTVVAVHPRHEGSITTPFFAVHPVGAHVVTYRELAARLGPDVPFYGLQSVGLDGSRPPIKSVEGMAAQYVTDIAGVQPHGPYALGGASFGGLVAFEMARQLRQAGEEVALLVLFDTDFPTFASSPIARWLSRSAAFRRAVYPVVRRSLSHLRTLSTVGWREYFAQIRQSTGMEVEAGQDAVRAGLEPDDRPAPSADTFTRHVQAVIDANYRAMANYVPRFYDGTITFFRATDATLARDTRALWRQVAAQVEVHDTPGNHFTVRREPNVRILAEKLRAALLSAVPNRTSESSILAPHPPARRATPATG